MLGRQTEFTEAVGAPGQVVPKRLASLSVSPMTRSETNLDASVEESGPVRADEFGPTDADEGVVQRAEELKYVPAEILPSKAEVESHSVSHLQFRIWCPACVRGRGLSLGHCKADTKTKEAEQTPTVSVDCGFFGQPEDRAHDTFPVLVVRDRKGKGIWSHPVPSTGVTHPFPARALMADVDFMVYRRVILKSDQEPSIVTLCERCQEWLARRLCARSISQGREQEERRGRTCRSMRTLKDFLEQSGITLESRSPLSAWLVEHCSKSSVTLPQG